MHITLIGMSNIGKSHWSKYLAAHSGFERVECDRLIEQRLTPELAKQSHTGIEDVAKWMGQPFDARYPEASRKYLTCERAVLEETLAGLQAEPRKPLVIDTTGSFIYAGDDIAEQLRALTRVVYLEASPEHATRLFERYVTAPKPVIWGDAFTPRPGEAPHAALARCYPELLKSRARRYAEIAHVTIPFERHNDPKAAISLFLEPDRRAP